MTTSTAKMVFSIRGRNATDSNIPN